MHLREIHGNHDGERPEEKRLPNGCLGDLLGMTFPSQRNRDYFINHERRILIKQPGFNGK